MEKIDIMINNLIAGDEALFPDEIKKELKKLKEIKPVAERIETSIAQTQESLNKLYDQRQQIRGAADVLLAMINENATPESIEKHGQQLNVPAK